MFDLSMLELPGKPMVSEFIEVSETGYVLNPNGIKCPPIVSFDAAQMYLRAAARFVAGWYNSLAVGYHTFSPASGPYFPNTGCYLSEGVWYFLDSANGKFTKTRNELPAGRAQAHTVNDSLLTYRVEIVNVYEQATWDKLILVLNEVLGAADRVAARAILNEHIAKGRARQKDRKELITAVQNGAEADIQSIIINGVDIMQFHTGTVIASEDGTAKWSRQWSAKNVFAVNQVKLALTKGQHLEYVPEDNVLVAG